MTPPLNFTLQKMIAPPECARLGGAEGSAGRTGRRRRAFTTTRSGTTRSRRIATILERSPSLSVINLQIAAAYRNKKDYDGAIGAYNALLKVDPANDKANVGIAMANLEKGDLDMAERTLETAAKAPGATREVFFDLGEVKMARAQADEAVKAYERAAEVDPTWGKPPLALGRIALDKGDAATARQALPASHGRRPGFARSCRSDRDAPSARTGPISSGEPLLWPVVRSVVR